MLLAAPAARASAGLDLAVVVDASGSMGRDRRIEPLLLQMTADLMARSGAENRVDHRLAVIAFGSTARVDLPFTPVRRDTMPALTKQIGALADEDLGDTNVLAAFSMADALFRGLPAEAERRRALVLLTDGVPYVRGDDMTAYREALRRFASAHFAKSDVAVDVLLIGHGAPREPELWRAVAEHVVPAGSTADEMLATAHATVTRMLGTRTVESMPAKSGAPVDTLVVPPYLEVVVFDVFRGAAGAEVLIFPPAAAEPLRAGSGGVEAFRLGDVLSTLVVPRPPPGEWTIRRRHRNAHVRILSQQFFPRGTLVAPRPADALRQYDRVRLAYRIIDSDGQPLRELAGYALSADLMLIGPNGSMHRIGTEPWPDGNGFRSTRDAECDLAGRYWTDVRITTDDARGRRIEVFRDRWSGFSVAAATRVDCRVSASAAMCLPVRTRVECASRGGGPIDLRQVAAGSPAEIVRAAVWRDGSPAQAALDLRYAGGGLLRGWLRGASRTGMYRLQLSADRAHLRPAYNVRFEPAELFIARRRPSPWLLLPLAIGVAGFAAFRARRRRTTESRQRCLSRQVREKT